MVLGMQATFSKVFKGKAPRALRVLGKSVLFPKSIHKRTQSVPAACRLIVE